MTVAHRDVRLIHRRARIFAALVALDGIAALVVDTIWPSALLPLVVGWCLSWLTAVAWVGFNAARNLR